VPEALKLATRTKETRVQSPFHVEIPMTPVFIPLSLGPDSCKFGWPTAGQFMDGEKPRLLSSILELHLDISFLLGFSFSKLSFILGSGTSSVCSRTVQIIWISFL
jgi:hypothetical protein